MQALIDTHAFLWMATGDARLRERWIQIVEDPDNEIFLSIGSLWEIAIKSGLSKLTVHSSLVEMQKKYVINRGLHELAITIHHLTQVQQLPKHHKDPFDRLIISQSIVEGIPIITADPKFALYPVELVS